MSQPSPNTVQPKKRLVICCDGTWNNSVSSNNPLTNVSRLSRCIEDVAADGVLQIVYYHTGIGSGTSKLSNSIDGATGRGIHHNIKNVYTFICLNFGNPDDEIYLIGFSRGAYTARCLAALIGTIGLLTKAGLVHINTLYKGWSKNQAADDSMGVRFESMLAKMERDNHLRRRINIEACAVWDTVSAIGLPRILTDMGSYLVDMIPAGQLLQLIPNTNASLVYNKLAFIDESIPRTLKNAFQALALNEMRTDFKPVFWANPPDTTVVKQCWFLGSHSDVGGGYADAGLANLTLVWMIAQLRTYTKLGISNEALRDYLTPRGLSNPKASHFALHEKKGCEKHNTTIIRGKINNSLKGLFILSGPEPRRPGEIVAKRHRRRALNLTTLLILGTERAFHATNRRITKLKHECMGEDGAPTGDRVQSNPDSELRDFLLEQSVHFSVRIMMAHKLNKCLLLEKRKTEFLQSQGDASVSNARPQVIWRRSEFNGRMDKLEAWIMKNISRYDFLLDEKEMLEEQACIEEIHLLEMWINQWETAEQQQPKTAKADEHEEDDGTHVPDTEDRQDDDGIEEVFGSENSSGSDTENTQPGALAEDGDKQEEDQSDQVDTDNDDVIYQPAGHQDQVETKKKKKKGKFGWKWPGFKKKISNPPLVTFLRPLLQEARQPNQMYPCHAQATAPMPESG